MNITTDQYEIETDTGSLPVFRATPTTIEKQAVFLPGQGYSCDMPLLYFSINLCLKKNIACTLSLKNYSRDQEWMAHDNDTKLAIAWKDAEKLFSHHQDYYQGLDLVIAKSLGTSATAHCIKSQLIKPKSVV